MQQSKDAAGLEAFEIVVGTLAAKRPWSSHHDDKNGGTYCFKFLDKRLAGHVFHVGVENNSADGRKLAKGVNCLSTAVGS